MENLGEKTASKAGSILMTIGMVMLVLSIGLLILNLTTGKGVPSIGFWVLLLAGTVMAVSGFARRILATR